MKQLAIVQESSDILILGRPVEQLDEIFTQSSLCPQFQLFPVSFFFSFFFFSFHCCSFEDLYFYFRYYGGWAAPNIYFLGVAGVVKFGNIRIGGLSGIYNARHYRLGGLLNNFLADVYVDAKW